MAYDVMPYAQAVLDVFPEKKKMGLTGLWRWHIYSWMVRLAPYALQSILFSDVCLDAGKKEARSDKLSEQINF